MLTRKEEKLLRGLAERRAREREGCFVAEGVRLVEDLLASPLRVRFVVHASTLEDTPRGAAVLDLARRTGVRTEPLPAREFTAYADTRTPQGVIAVAESPETTLAELEAPPEPRAGILVLDAVQDPGNFGTLVRTAEALGARAVFLLPGTVDPWNPKSVRAAMGSSFRLPLVETRWEEAAPWLRSHGFGIYAAAADGDPRLPDRAGNVALVVGNEGSGISAETRSLADRVVAIRLRGRAESLNVTAAAAILLHALMGSPS
jgi:RNA methyltransferase, TrmH family